MTELSPDAKKLFETAREAFSPDEARLHALHSALQARLAAPSATATAATKVALLTKTTALIGLGLVTAAVISVKTFAPQAVPQAVSQAPVHVSAPIVTTSSLSTRAAQPPAAEEVAAAATPSASATAVAPSAMPTRVLEPTVAAAVVVPKLSVARATVQSPTRVTPRAQTTSREAPPTTAIVARAPEMPIATERETPTPEPAVREQPIAPRADNLADELALMQRAHAALERGDAAAALGVLDQHEERFSRGILTQERIATRALALCSVGRTAEARSAARGLLRLAPRSPHLVRLRASCAWPQTPVD